MTKETCPPAAERFRKFNPFSPTIPALPNAASCGVLDPGFAIKKPVPPAQRVVKNAVLAVSDLLIASDG